MVTGIRGASNAKGQPRAGVEPGAPELAGGILREGFRGIDEQVTTIVFATLAVGKWDRRPDRLVNQEVRLHGLPLPHHRVPSGQSVRML